MTLKNDPSGTRLGETILAVDDDPLVLRVVQRILKQKGWHVETANGIPEAIELIHRLRTEIDLLITDCEMPGGTGADVIKEAREAGITRILAITGGFHRQGTQEAMAEVGIGLSDCVEKPFDHDTICARVKAILSAEKPAADTE